ncbi:MAG TPA: alpha/beta fold hydrolase [Acidimicrobiales bacterium]|nr:alpha/beta fold hydrolase [Acidimicrobiales bacterium]
MKEPGISAWRSDRARRRFVEMEDELWREQWPEPPAALDIDTWAGPTRLYRWAGAGEPIVFLHGMGGTGLTWSPYVQRLAGRDVYAVDTIGDVGRSEQRAVIEDAAGLARWLGEALTGAGIERAHLAGTSYGGFLALALASREPQRAASLTLVDSGGLAPFRLGRFLLWGLPSLFGALAPAPVRRRLARRRPLLADPRIMRMGLHGQMNHPFRLPGVAPLGDDELRSITAPALVIVAGRSAPFAPRVQAERARLIPRAEVEVIPGAGHEVSWTHLDRCVAGLSRVAR